MSGYPTYGKNTKGTAPVSASPPPGLLGECVMIAEELLDALRDEAQRLRQHDRRDFLEVVSRKEFLVRELGDRMRVFGDGKLDTNDPVYPAFKNAVMEIDRLNRANEVFIRGSLEYWQDFLSAFNLPAYGPTADETRKKTMAPRGLSLNREA